MNIYVGNLSYNTTDSDLRATFERYGQVESAHIIMDRETNQSRGFGFVEMPDDDAAQAAIEALNGSDLNGRSIRVNPARPRPDQKPRRAGPGGR